MQQHKIQLGKKKSIFIGYLLSYLSIVVITIAIISIVLISNFIKSINEMNKKTLENKMDIVIHDMNMQMDELSSIALHVKVGKEFNPHLQKQSKIADVELLEALSKYINNSFYSSNYFFFYNSGEQVFQCKVNSFSATSYAKGRSIDFPYFCEYELGIDSVDDFRYQLISKSEISFFLLNDEVVIISFPINIASNMENASHGVLGFITSISAIRNRIKSVSGDLPGGYILNLGNYSAYSPTA